MASLTDSAAWIIADRVSTDQRIMRDRLLTLDPLEAISLLGPLVDDTIKRFPADYQPSIRAAFCAELLGLPEDE
jgi:hypothetical protein